MITEQILYTFGWTPWSSIIAGCVSALAISVILAILGIALGFTVVSPKSDDPASGLGVAFGVWGGFSVVVSMAAGGFVAGFLAGQRGLEIGFLVWALTMLGAMCVSGVAVGVAVKVIGSVMVNIGSGAVTVAGGVSQGALDATANLFNEIKDNFQLDFDTEKVNDHILDVLRDTGVDTLQPEYLRGQLREIKSEAKNLLFQLALNPSEYEQSITGFLNKANGRLKDLVKDVDKNTAIAAITKTRNIPREEAAKLVDNALYAYGRIQEKARDTLAEAKTQMEDARRQLKLLADQAREKADKLASAAAKAALGAAFALILAAAISMGTGYCGATYASSLLPVAGQVKSTTIAP